MKNIYLITHGKEKTEKMQEILEKETSKLVKMLGDDLEEIRAVVKVINSNEEKTELNVHTKDGLFRKELVGESYFTTISELCKNIENQIREYNDKKNDIYIQRRRNKKDVLKDVDIEDGESFEVEYEDYINNLLGGVRHKKINPKPMFREDAVLEMERIDHLFFMYIDAETFNPCVVYKRRNGGYGILEMEV